MNELEKYHVEMSFGVGVATTVWAESKGEAIKKAKKDVQHGLVSSNIDDAEIFSAEFDQVTYIG